jgi:hypothetical protein
MSPLVKNMGLAFLAGFVVSISAAAEKAGDVPPSRAFIVAALFAAVYAGGRGVIGYAKEHFTGEAFSVDTEA